MKYPLSQIFCTYSIVARDPETGQHGVAVQTHQMSVGSIVPWLQSGVGAVATQSLVNISFGPVGLSLLREGVRAQSVVDALVASDSDAHRRQVAVVDREGRAAAWTGNGCIPEANHQTGEGFSVQANMMTNPTVASAMAAAFETASGDLAQRMIAALEAAQTEDGDIRGMQSAALVVVPGDISKPGWVTDYDLRVDEHNNPVKELARLVRLHHAQRLDEQGHEAFQAGQHESALKLWTAARSEAPELEEIVFWQAVTLADAQADIQTAVSILRPALASEPRRDHWIELIRRLEVCGLLERKGAANELIHALMEP